MLELVATCRYANAAIEGSGARALGDGVVAVVGTRDGLRQIGTVVRDRTDATSVGRQNVFTKPLRVYHSFHQYPRRLE